MNDRVLRRVLDPDQAASDSSVAWNAFVDLIATEPYEALSPLQRVAHLAFWYDSEVQNGGHLQYFENTSSVHVEETLAALAALGAEHHAAVLRNAWVRWSEAQRERLDSVDARVAEALVGEFTDLDETHCSAVPSITALLVTYLNVYHTDFIEYKPAEQPPSEGPRLLKIAGAGALGCGLLVGAVVLWALLTMDSFIG